MKKIFLGVAFIAAILASCSQNETLEMSERNAINFRVTTEYASRAVEYNSTNLMSEINVTAVKSDNNNLFSNKTWTNNSGSWTTTNPVFWPNSTDKLNFYGYYPTDLTTNLTIENFEPEHYAKNQEDVMVAFNQCSQGEQGTVALHFKHLLSQIAVQAKNMNESYTIKVRGVKLSGFKTTASIDLPSTQTVAGTPVDKVWSGMNGSTYYVATQDVVTLDEIVTPITGTNEDEDKVSTFMVLPQQLEAWDGVIYENVTGAYIGVLCQIIRNTDDVIIYPKQDADEDLYAYTTVPINTNLEMGKKYTYTLVFFDGENGGAGLVDPKPNEGTDLDGDGDGTDDKVDNNPSINDGIENGEDDDNEEGNTQGGIISTKAISVSVSSDDWTEGETVDKDMGAKYYKAVDLGLSVDWMATVYGATSQNPYGELLTYAEAEAQTVATDGWRLPTKEECEELLSKCNPEWITEGCVNGYRFTAENGNSIFLPAAGYRYGTWHESKNSYMGFWLSELHYADDTYSYYSCLSKWDIYASDDKLAIYYMDGGAKISACFVKE